MLKLTGIVRKSGIPIISNAGTLLHNLSLYSDQAEFIQTPLNEKQNSYCGFQREI